MEGEGSEVRAFETRYTVVGVGWCGVCVRGRREEVGGEEGRSRGGGGGGSEKISRPTVMSREVPVQTMKWFFKLGSRKIQLP